jgi:hypothetical protein
MPWLIDDVFRQGDSEGLIDLPVTDSRSRPTRFVHVVNPFRSPGGDCDDRTQALSYETMRRAKDFSLDVPVHLAAVVAEAEQDCVPEAFDLAGTLSRTVEQIAQFEHPRPLPLLFDILELGCRHATELAGQHGDAPEDVFLVYSNADICLMPHFYGSVAALVAHGFDAMTINRRTIPAHLRELGSLSRMYAEFGESHPGYDCFVFPLAHCDRYVRSDAFVGGDFVARNLLYNMIANSTNMLMLRQAHLTFHIGNEKRWQDPKFKDYRDFNMKQAIGIILTIIERDSDAGSKVIRFCHSSGEPIKFTKKDSVGAG